MAGTVAVVGAQRSVLVQLARVVLGLIGKRQPWLSFVAGGLCIALVRKIIEIWQRVRRARAELEWRRHVDLSEIQACLLSTEHLESLGRVEKRTLFVKPISELFKNEYIQARVLEAAQKAAESKDPMLMVHLSPEDKWHVLNTCTNHISSLFAPHHVFFNEARRTRSYYKSAWYCFTLTCHQNASGGRWFITPFRPVTAGDKGCLRIRMVLASEQELRDITAGVVDKPESGMFNGRHDNRWQVFQRFADLFARQLGRVSESRHSPLSHKRFPPKKVASQVRLHNFIGNPLPTEIEIGPEDNAILRIHIPFPSSHGRDEPENVDNESENRSRDVVLFE